MSLDIGESPRERGNELLLRHPVWSDEALGKVVAQVKILDRQHFGVAENDIAHTGRDRKGDLNIVVQVTSLIALQNAIESVDGPGRARESCRRPAGNRRK
jgi:hypothetical protein